MAAGNPSTDSGCAAWAGGRFERESAGVRAIEPVTSLFGAGAVSGDGALNAGKFGINQL
jgi:hypothetical protein